MSTRAGRARCVGGDVSARLATTRRLAAVALAAAGPLTVGTVAALATTTAPPGTAPAARRSQPGGTLDLARLDQTFAVGADETITLRYVADPALPAATTTTTTTPTTVTPAVAGDAVAPPVDAAAPSAPAAATTQPPVTPPAPVDDVFITLYPAVSDRAELIGSPVASRRDPLDTVTLDLPPASADGLTISVATVAGDDRPGALHLPRAGLYPLTVEVRSAGRVVGRDRTFVWRRPDRPTSDPPLGLAVVAAVDDPGPLVESGTAASASRRAQLTAIADLAEQVDAPVAVAIPPAVLTWAEIAAPDVMTRLQQALVGDEALATPARTLDPSSAAAAGIDDQFVDELRHGADLLATGLPSTTIDDSVWLTATPLSTSGAALLRDLGVRMIVLTRDRYDELDGNINPFTDTSRLMEADLGNGARLPVMVLDDITGDLALVATTDTATPASTSVERAVDALAEILVMRSQLGPRVRRSLVLTGPDFATPDPAVVSAMARYAGTLDEIALVPLSALPASTDAMLVNRRPVSLTLPETAGVDLAGRVSALAAVRLQMDSTASMLPAGDTRPAAWAELLDTLLSTAVDDVEANRVMGELVGEADRIRGAVIAPEPFTFTLTGRSSELRIRLQNTSNTELSVVVQASSPKLTFPAGEQLTTLPPNASRDVLVPVVARSNGRFPVSVEIRTPAGEVIAGPVPLTARVRTLTGLTQVLSGAALLILAAWWYSHLRGRRRERSLAVAAERHPALVEQPELSFDAAEAQLPEHAPRTGGQARR